VSIVPNGSAQVRCIAVAASDQLYVTKDYIVTHNTHLAMSASELGLGKVAYLDLEGSTTGVYDKFDQSKIDVVRVKERWPGKEWGAFKTLTTNLLAKPHDYGVVVIDPLNTAFEWGKKAGEKPGDGFAKWNFVHEQFTEDGGLIAKLKAAPFLAIVILHEKESGGEDDTLTKADFRWQGQGTGFLGQYPDMVGYVTRATNSAGVSTSTLSTAPTSRNNAKNRFGLPAKIVDPSLPKVYDLIRGEQS
jgi:hypothetical protein